MTDARTNLYFQGFPGIVYIYGGVIHQIVNTCSCVLSIDGAVKSYAQISLQALAE